MASAASSSSNSGSMFDQFTAASALAQAAARAAANSADTSRGYQQLLAGLTGISSSNSIITSAASIMSNSSSGSLLASGSGGSFWENDFKLFANSMTSQPSMDTSTALTSLSNHILTDTHLPPTLTPSPSLHTPSPGIVGQHTPSPSLGHAPSSPSTPGGSSYGALIGGHGGLPTPSPSGTSGQEMEAAQMLWARYLESTQQHSSS